MTIPLPDKEAVCAYCGHAYKFHCDLDGLAVSCDALMVLDFVDTNETSDICSCEKFIQIVDPEEFVSS